MTPREFWAAVRGHEIAELRRLKAAISAAYYGAAFQRADRLPKLSNVLKGVDPPEPKPPIKGAAARKKMDDLAAMFGGRDLRKRKAKEGA